MNDLSTGPAMESIRALGGIPEPSATDPRHGTNGPSISIQARISIIGLGYVGAVSAACFARMGYDVRGVDRDAGKIAAMASGTAPVVEQDLEDLIRNGVRTGRLSAGADVAAAVSETDITLICVGTPGANDGKADLSALRAVATELGRALADKTTYHLVVVRSTVPTGTTRNTILPILEQESRRRGGEDFGLCHHPEFLREGTAISDFFDPAKIVIGAIDRRSADVLAAIYDGIAGSMIHTSLETAEMVKCVDNTWHAVKVSFANEIGRLCQGLGADAKEVMEIFSRDTKLNLSAYYLRPGFAFGGSCLPKDVRAMCMAAREHGIALPLIESILPSNDVQIGRAQTLIENSGGQRIGFLGVTFKPGTDDLRESPQIELLGRLFGMDAEFRVHDNNITPSGLNMARAHARTARNTTKVALRMLDALRSETAEELTDWADVIVVSHNTSEYVEVLRGRGTSKHIIDLIGLAEKPLTGGYVGICW